MPPDHPDYECRQRASPSLVLTLSIACSTDTEEAGWLRLRSVARKAAGQDVIKPWPQDLFVRKERKVDRLPGCTTRRRSQRKPRIPCMGLSDTSIQTREATREELSLSSTDPPRVQAAHADSPWTRIGTTPLSFLCRLPASWQPDHL